MKDGFIKIAAVTPQVKVADVTYNVGEIIKLYQEAATAGAKIIVFPKLCITGATAGDLLYQEALIKAAKAGLQKIVTASKNKDAIVFVGLPDENGKSVTAVVQNGKVLDTVKNKEDFLLEVSVNGTDTVFTVGLCYRSRADIVVFPLAEYDLVCADTVRTQEALAGSRRNACILVQANAGEGESTTDFVYAGHNVIAQCGKLLTESGSFTNGINYAVADVDLISCTRRMQKSKRDLTKKQPCTDSAIKTTMEHAGVILSGVIKKNPFIADDEQEMKRRIAHIYMLQTMGLKKRLMHTNSQKAVIGISGGLDSTLALLVTVNAFDLLGFDRKNITAVTMPCFGTSDRTHSNAQDMMDQLGVTSKEISIADAINQHFKDIEHDPENHNAAYENAQARERTQILMDMANDLGALMIGTGDLSELALGWATYNGDHMSNYAVNADVPKTLMRRIVSYLADEAEKGFYDKGSAKGAELAKTLRDVVDTPVSPELLPPKEGEIAQKTEDIVGPYELHDFFLYYMLRYGFMPHKIYRMAVVAFAGVYDGDTIRKWITVFYKRFFAQQFKRSCLPDGPKIGSVGLSPRGDLSMPSDAISTVWLDDLAAL
ncbi:MAG: NAD(+) synthase [Lachnospiraceae bacterium]|nr:NAD(+) synthase [Lachnospiraceae bacterium]